MFQEEETVHYVPATNTPDSTHTDNVYPVYNPEYYPEYYQVLQQDFYPQPPMVETVEEDCFFLSPELSQNQQSILPERKRTLITFQCPNDDDGQDIIDNDLQGGTAMYEPESLFPGENVSVPQHVSPPEPASPPEPVSPPEHIPTYMIPYTEEETVHYVPATNTPDSAHTDNVYPMYNPQFYQVLPPDVYPQPPAVETVEEDCFLPSPELPQFLQPFLPERKHTMITKQDK